MKCRFCNTSLEDVFVDLGCAPPSNAFLTREALTRPESWYPLKLYTCGKCRLVQVNEAASHKNLFSSDYVYHSSFSRSWLAHAERYVADCVGRLGLNGNSLVVEIASNDGYLLQYVKALGIPCLGIEPTASTAAVARGRGIETIESFFGREFARGLLSTRGPADLLIANNVLAHVPDPNDFVAGLAALVAADGAITVEFPHLLELVTKRQFDTIYHEHFSYFSLHTALEIFQAHGLRIWDVEQLATHGGSLRIWAAREAGARAQMPRVAELLRLESEAGMLSRDYYAGFQAQAEAAKNGFLEFLLQQWKSGKHVAAYGAAAKGNTLLNFAGVKPDLLPYVVDASPYKQGLYLPGSHIPVVDESVLRESRPYYVVILPWNLRDEIVEQLDYIRTWDGKFVTAIPELTVL